LKGVGRQKWLLAASYWLFDPALKKSFLKEKGLSIVTSSPDVSWDEFGVES
jgi:hypothetical protein